MFSLRGLKASEPLDEEESEAPRFWVPSLPKEHFDPFKRAVLVSPDLEADVLHHVSKMALNDEEYDLNVCTTLSDTCIPIHGFMLAGRSPNASGSSIRVP